MNSLVLKHHFLIILVIAPFALKYPCACNMTGNFIGTDKPPCGSLDMEEDKFNFSEVHLKYDLYKLGAVESDRIELGIAHSGFSEMRGEINVLQWILLNSDNYSLENKPSISADFTFDNCSGKRHKDYSYSEVVGNSLSGTLSSFSTASSGFHRKDNTNI